MSGRIAAGIYPNLKFKFLPGLAFSEMNLPKKTEFSDFVVTSENVLGKTFHILPQFNCFTKSFYGLLSKNLFALNNTWVNTVKPRTAASWPINTKT